MLLAEHNEVLVFWSIISEFGNMNIKPVSFFTRILTCSFQKTETLKRKKYNEFLAFNSKAKPLLVTL